MQIKYYETKPISDYESLHLEWLLEEPVYESYVTVSINEDSPDFDADLETYIKQLTRFEEAQMAWLLREPQIETTTFKPVGPFFVDICRGQAPVKLLFRQQFNRKFPTKPIQELLLSQKARHKHWGPYDHSLVINIYDQGDMMGLKSLEVNLWQQIPDVAILEEMAKAVRTGRQTQRIYRLSDSTQKM